MRLGFGRRGLGLSLGALLALGACTSQRSVGSTCDEGVCETLSSAPRLPCLLSTTPQLPALAQPCVMEEQHVHDNGTVACRLYVALGDQAASCASEGLSDAASAFVVPGTLCQVQQLTDADRAAGGALKGWYLETIDDPSDSCYGVAPQRLKMQGTIAQGAASFLVCGKALVDPADVLPTLRTGESPLPVSPESCAGLPPLPSRTPIDVGAVCEPHVEPVGGFSSDYNYVDVRSEQCSSGVCLVSSLGAEAATCTPTQEFCEPGAQLTDRVYCSCRCDAKGDVSRAQCACPSGYYCADVLNELVPRSLAGGYCMREGFE